MIFILYSSFFSVGTFFRKGTLKKEGKNESSVKA